jgi:PAS domain S-box-containing protein
MKSSQNSLPASSERTTPLPEDFSELSQLRELIDHVSDLIHSVDREGRFIFVNRKWCETLGYTFAEAAQLTIFDLLSASDQELARTLRERLYASADPQPFSFASLLRRKDGRFVPVEGVMAVVFKDGKPSGTRSVFRDISERQRSEAAMRSQLLAIQAASEGIAWIDAEGNFQHLNPAHVKLFGFEREEELIGKNWEKLYAKADLKDFKDAVSASLEQQGRWSGKVSALRRDGVAFSLNVSVTALPGGGFLAVCHDNSSQVKTEQQMIQNLAREKQLNELQAHFVSMASHEMRTPLATLSLGVEFLVKYWTKLDDTQIHHSLQTVHAGVQQLRAVLDDVLVVGRSEEGRLVCKPSPIELVGFCRKLADEVQSRDLQRHSIVILCDHDAIDASVDPQLLRHILSSLLSNACKFSPEKSEVRLDLTQRDGSTLFTVIDQGIGIPLADQPRVYDLFFRASNASKITGSGLGLSVVRRCVDAHGGSVAFDSVPDRGTRFFVTLPA